MIESLILVRHAKTEPRSPELDDSRRQLTSAGVRSARAALPRALALVENPKDYRIWSSPAVRAWQTAEIVAGALGLSEIEKTPDLYSDEVAALRQRINDEEGHLVMVGHNPYLEELAEDLDSAHLHFNKSAVACYTFPDGSLASADLAWFVQGPDSSRWETLVEMEAGLQRAARKVSGATWAFFDDPKSPEKLQEAREAVRRCLALLGFAKPYLKKRQFQQMHGAMEAFYRDTSDLKKLVVPSQSAVEWSGIPFVTPEAQRMYDRLRITEAERSRILAKMQTPTRQKALHVASQNLRSPRWKSKVEAEGVERAELRRRFKKMKRALRQEREAIETLDESGRDADVLRKLQKREERIGHVADGFAPLFKKDRDPGDHATN